jgi:hypothetical protein
MKVEFDVSCERVEVTVDGRHVGKVHSPMMGLMQMPKNEEVPENSFAGLFREVMVLDVGSKLLAAFDLVGDDELDAFEPFDDEAEADEVYNKLDF